MGTRISKNYNAFLGKVGHPNMYRPMEKTIAPNSKVILKNLTTPYCLFWTIKPWDGFSCFDWYGGVV